MGIEPAPPRAARCRHHELCGGCGWQQVGYPEQLRLKQQALDELLRGVLGARAPRVEATIGLAPGPDGSPWGFRQKAAFAFGSDAGGELVMGHYARASHDVVPVVECPVHAPRANRIAFALFAELRRAGLAAADRRNGVLRHVLVRTSADEKEAVLVLVATRDDKRLRGALRRLLASADRPEGAMLNLHERPGPYLLGRETLRVDGLGHVEERVLGTSFLVSPTGFFQTNVAAAGAMVRLALAALPERRTLNVLDLYAGSGLFALPIAGRGHRVTAVEESRKATRDAARNAERNGIPRTRLRLLPQRVETALPALIRERFDVVLLDPPRQGCPPAVLKLVAGRLRPQRLILVSCNPQALARELPVVLDAGYRVRTLQPVDMFPHTPHLEALAVLERAGTALKRPRSRSRAAPAGSPGRTRSRGRRSPPAPPASRSPRR